MYQIQIIYQVFIFHVKEIWNKILEIGSLGKMTVMEAWRLLLTLQKSSKNCYKYVWKSTENTEKAWLPWAYWLFSMEKLWATRSVKDHFSKK